MIPTAYEFRWDLGHLVFLGLFYTVLTVVAVTVAVAVVRWLGDLRRRRAPAIAWQEIFAGLPPERRLCRHALTGTAPDRICERGFDCAGCPEHADFAAAGTAATQATAPDRERFHHRGHTWVVPRPDGTADVGLDALATRCLGRPDQVVLPAPGTDLQSGDRLATIRRGRISTRVLTPLAGQVVALGDLHDGWLCRVRPAELGHAHLLHGAEAEVWMLREFEALQAWLSPTPAAPVLADGGQPVADLVAAYPDADWDAILGQVCLEA